jgi:hypothetical protein
MNSKLTRRRWLLGASSAALALPALEIFTPRPAAAAATKPRLLVYYLPNGRKPEWWVPTTSGGVLTFPGQAAALQPFADQALSLVNLSNNAALASPGAAHAMGTGTVMTGVTIPGIAGGALHNDITLDQLIVRELAPQTRFSSLQFSAGEPGPCDVGGSSCAYTQSISWTGPASPLVPTIDPRAAYERLFGAGIDGLEGPAGELRRQSMRSVLDFVKDDSEALQQKLGQGDKHRLEEYFDAVRELEQNLFTEASCEDVGERPIGGLPYDERIDAFHQLIKLAFQCDQTRVISFMIEFGLSGRSHDFLGAPGGHHALSHYTDTSGRDRLEVVETYQAQKLGEMLGLLRATPSPSGGTLLDETIVLVIPSMGSGHNHDHANNCPILFGGKGTINADGRQIAFPAGALFPLPNLHVSLLHAYGIEGSFGHSGAIFGDDGTAPIDGIVA